MMAAAGMCSVGTGSACSGISGSAAFEMSGDNGGSGLGGGNDGDGTGGEDTHSCSLPHTTGGGACTLATTGRHCGIALPSGRCCAGCVLDTPLLAAGARNSPGKPCRMGMPTTIGMTAMGLSGSLVVVRSEARLAWAAIRLNLDFFLDPCFCLTPTLVGGSVKGFGFRPARLRLRSVGAS